MLGGEGELKNLIELGTCKKVHGIKGEFSLFLFNPEDSVLAPKMQVMLFPLDSSSVLSAQGEKFTITTLRFGNKTILKLDEVQDRNYAEQLIPFSLRLDRKHFPPLSEGEFYISDLVGFALIASDGAGEVVNFYQNQDQTILVLRWNNTELELPFVDSFFGPVSVKAKTIEFFPPEIL